MYDSPPRTPRDRQSTDSRRTLVPTVALAAVVTTVVALASLGPTAAAFAVGALAGALVARATARRLPALVGPETTYRVAGLDVEISVSTAD